MKRYQASEWHQRPVVPPSLWKGITVALILELAATTAVLLLLWVGLSALLWILSA